jgi:hypothetical protein
MGTMSIIAAVSLAVFAVLLAVVWFASKPGK